MVSYNIVNVVVGVELAFVLVISVHRSAFRLIKSSL